MNLVFQKEFNSGMDEYGQQLQELCSQLGINFYPIVVRPFEHTVQDDREIANLQGPTIAYGSNVMVDVVKNYGWKPGWFDVPDKETDAYGYFGKDYINSDMLVCNTDNYIQSLKLFGMYDMEFYFMKPNDQKYFPGTIVDKKMMPFVIESQGKHFGTPDVYDICISRVKKIEAEWRFFVVGRTIVDGSKYHAEELKLDVKQGYDPQARTFAENMIGKYHPLKDNFVIDIAKMKNGDYKVVEINCLNSSGFYKVDLKSLLIHLKQYCSSNSTG